MAPTVSTFQKKKTVLGLFVGVSCVSFLIPPTAYPARCGLLTTTLLVRSNYYNFSLVYFALICFCTKVLINLFISALWTTPNDSIGLTALATWILGCIAFVFIALLFYVVILINMKVVSKRVNAKVSSFGAKKWKSDDPRVPRDMDPLFLMIHLLAFALFVITYFFVYIA